MNKPTMMVTRQRAQSGFTLIELIVVIVILGILAATALPRFSSLGGDARVASLNAARGALLTTGASAHGSWLITPTTTTLTYEGQAFTLATTVVSGYPAATAAFAAAAGLSSDYTIIAPSTASATNNPATTATSIAIIPNSVAGTPKGAVCFISYTEPTAVNAQPVISAAPTAANCQ